MTSSSAAWPSTWAVKPTADRFRLGTLGALGLLQLVTDLAFPGHIEYRLFGHVAYRSDLALSRRASVSCLLCSPPAYTVSVPGARCARVSSPRTDKGPRR